MYRCSRKRSRDDTPATDNTLTVINKDLLHFVACTTEPDGVKHLLQCFLFNIDISELKNIPNWELWKNMPRDFNTNINLSVSKSILDTCNVSINGKDAVKIKLKRNDDILRDLQDPSYKNFYATTIFRMEDWVTHWTYSLTLNDIGCVLCRFLLVIENTAYLCNMPEDDGDRPIVLYSLRESTDTEVPTALNWHQDKPPDRSGALLNFIRSTDDNGGASTEILCPLSNGSLPSPNDEGVECVKCDPFPKNRTVVFNGAWYHRAPKSGGAREFLQVDLQDIESNKKLVNMFLKTFLKV